MSPQTTHVLVCAMMRKLWQFYDSGGESGRSVRAQLLEAALSLAPEKLPHVFPDEQFFKAVASQAKSVPPLSAPVALDIATLTEEDYFSWVIRSIMRGQPEETSIIKRTLLTHISLLLRAEQRVGEYERRGISFSPQALIAEGRRRTVPN